MTIKNYCNFPGCRALCSEYYCDEHRQKKYRSKRPSGSRRNPSGFEWNEQRLAIARKQGFACADCGKTVACIDATGEPKISGHLHHITPRADGGTDDAANLQMLCGRCHARHSLAEARDGLRAVWRSRPTKAVQPKFHRRPE